MIAELTFTDPRREGHRSVREARFSTPAPWTLELVCTLGNRIREALCALAGAEVETAVAEPVRIDARSYATLTTGARIYAAPEGTLQVLVGPATVEACASAALGVEVRAPLSALEGRFVDQSIAQLAEAFRVLGCRTVRPAVAAAHDPAMWYADVRCSGAFSGTFGVTFVPQVRAFDERRLSIGCIGGVWVDVRAELGTAALKTHEFVALRAGSVVRLSTKVSDCATLKVGQVSVADGECGLYDPTASGTVRFAFWVRTANTDEGPSVR